MKILVPIKKCGNCFHYTKTFADDDILCHNTLSCHYDEATDPNDSCDQWMLEFQDETGLPPFNEEE